MSTISTKKILLVEDDVYIADIYSTILTKNGYSVVVAKDGEHALELLPKDKYDLILLDIMLPKLTGFDVLKIIKEDYNSTLVYLLTNLGEENITKEAYKLGANGYFLKAKYLPRQLLEKIDEIFKERNKTGIEVTSA